MKVMDKVKNIRKGGEFFGEIGTIVEIGENTYLCDFDSQLVSCLKDEVEEVKPKEELYAVWDFENQSFYKYDTLEDAENQVERLLNSYPQEEFYIFKAIKKGKGIVKVGFNILD